MNHLQEQISRRQFLKTAGKAALGTGFAAAGFTSTVAAAEADNGQDDLDKYDFIMPRVRYTHEKKEVDRWNVRPGGDANLLRALSSVIRCKVKPILDANNWQPQWAREGQLNAVAAFDEPEKLKKYPFLFMTGENQYKLDNPQKTNLREYILRGGFLFMDDCVVGNGGDFFYKSSYELLEQAFAKGSVERIPLEHEIFHNVYDLGDTGLPFMKGQNHGARGVFIGERLAVFLSSTDIHCGWCDSYGFTFGRHNYEKAIQMGINIIMYALSH